MAATVHLIVRNIFKRMDLVSILYILNQKTLLYIHMYLPLPHLFSANMINIDDKNKSSYTLSE